jgi:plasmid stabilization system protein ParE
LLIALTPEADAHVRALERFYIEKRRPQALRNLGHALAEASLIIMNAPERGLPAPRPYPALASLGLSWLKRGRYWIAYAPSVPIIAGVFFETDDIPNRV